MSKITFPNKTSGNTLSATEVNEAKTSVNALYDLLDQLQIDVETDATEKVDAAKQEINTSLQSYYLKTEVNTLLAGKLNTGSTFTSASVTDFTEAVQDAVAALFAAGTHVNITPNYDDAGNRLSFTVTSSGGTGLDAEAVRDTLGIALQGIGNISVTPNDAGDTITISTTATVNSTDAALRDRGTHTGEQPISTVTGLQALLDSFLASASFTGAAIKGLLEGLSGTNRLDAAAVKGLASVATSGAYGDLTGRPTIIDSTGPTSVLHVWSGTQVQYDAIGSKDANTLYYIV